MCVPLTSLLPPPLPLLPFPAFLPPRGPRLLLADLGRYPNRIYLRKKRKVSVLPVGHKSPLSLMLSSPLMVELCLPPVPPATRP